MIPAFNANATLPDTLTSVLAQDPGPAAMQIEVVDDCSTRDDTQRLIEQIGDGRIGFFRQPRNLGVAGNLTQCIRRARGKLVHLLHADDLVEPGFYLSLGQVFASQPHLGAAFCRHRFIDAQGRTLSLSPLEREESGVLENAVERLAEEQRIMTPAMVVRRSVYEEVGGFDARLICAEDWEMWVRLSLEAQIDYLPVVTTKIRTHSGNSMTNAAGMRRSMARAADLFEQSTAIRSAHSASLRRMRAKIALVNAINYCSQRDTRTSLRCLREAIEADARVLVDLRYAYTIVRLLKNNLRL